MLVKFIERDFKCWAAYLPGICLAYNSSIHTATGYAPHELFYSFPPTCPFDVVVEAEQTEAASNADQYALEATDRLKQAFQFVYEYSGHVADRMKSNYDAAIKPKHFEIGSFVLVYTPPKQQSHVYGKWKVAWQGPFRVMKRLNATNYIVKRSHKARENTMVKLTTQRGRMLKMAVDLLPYLGLIVRPVTQIRPPGPSTVAHAT